MQKDKPINVRVNSKLKERIITKAAEMGMSFSEAVRYALTKWVEGK